MSMIVQLVKDDRRPFGGHPWGCGWKCKDPRIWNSGFRLKGLGEVG